MAHEPGISTEPSFRPRNPPRWCTSPSSHGAELDRRFRAAPVWRSFAQTVDPPDLSQAGRAHLHDSRRQLHLKCLIGVEVAAAVDTHELRRGRPIVFTTPSSRAATPQPTTAGGRGAHAGIVGRQPKPLGPLGCGAGVPSAIIGWWTCFGSLSLVAASGLQAWAVQLIRAPLTRWQVMKTLASRR